VGIGRVTLSATCALAWAAALDGDTRRRLTIARER